MTTEKKTPTLSELRESAKALKDTLNTIESDIAEKQKTRAKMMKEYRSLTGRIVTLEIAEEAKK